MIRQFASAAALAAALTVGAEARAQLDWASDLRQVRQVLEENHPDFYARLDRAAFDAAYAELARDIGALSDGEAVIRLAELVALGQDGHTRLTLPLAPEAGLFATHRATEPPRVALFGQFPLRLRRAQDGYVVIGAAPEFSYLLGARVVSIDGVHAAAIEERLMPVIHGDNLHHKRALAASFMVVPEVLVARGVAQNDGRAVWRLRLADGSERAVRLRRRDSDEEIRWRHIAGHMPQEAQQSISRTEDNVLIVRIAEVTEATPGGFARFCASLEETLAEQPPRAVLIDLRGNIGGDNSLIDPLVRLLVRDRALWAPGRLFVAIDGATFSAAIRLATALELWTPAVFIGSPTGGAPNHHGDAQRVQLAESGLTLRVSSLYWQMTDPRDARDAIAPLVDVEPRVEDVRTGVDPALSLVRASSRDVEEPLEGQWRGRIALGRHMLGIRITMGATSTMDIPDAGFPTAQLVGLRADGASVEAGGETAGYPFVLRARHTEAGLIGSVELRGRFYPFVAERAGG
jgi:hypothetical protein